MSDSHDSGPLLEQFGATARPGKSARNGAVKPEKSGQRQEKAGPRTEKGTNKVVIQELNESASGLFVALTEGFKIEDQNTRDKFLTAIMPEVEKVLGDLGLARDRMQTKGEKMVSAIISDIERDDIIAEMELKLKAVETELRAMKEGHLGLREVNSEIDGIDDEVLIGDKRSTRNSVSLKRSRTADAIEQHLDDMKAISKRMKGNDKVARRRS